MFLTRKAFFLCSSLFSLIYLIYIFFFNINCLSPYNFVYIVFCSYTTTPYYPVLLIMVFIHMFFYTYLLFIFSSVFNISFFCLFGPFIISVVNILSGRGIKVLKHFLGNFKNWPKTEVEMN